MFHSLPYCFELICDRNEERAEDEKRIEKLLKDVTKGGLRKKRTAEFDLSDSDDEIEAKKRRKRNEFARMRKALLEDENVGKIGTRRLYDEISTAANKSQLKIQRSSHSSAPWRIKMNIKNRMH